MKFLFTAVFNCCIYLVKKAQRHENFKTMQLGVHCIITDMDELLSPHLCLTISYTTTQPFNSAFGRLTQRESAILTRWKPRVQTPDRPPIHLLISISYPCDSAIFPLPIYCRFRPWACAGFFFLKSLIHPQIPAGNIAQFRFKQCLYPSESDQG